MRRTRRPREGEVAVQAQSESGSLGGCRSMPLTLISHLEGLWKGHAATWPPCGDGAARQPRLLVRSKMPQHPEMAYLLSTDRLPALTLPGPQQGPSQGRAQRGGGRASERSAWGMPLLRRDFSVIQSAGPLGSSQPIRPCHEPHPHRRRYLSKWPSLSHNHSLELLQDQEGHHLP